MNKRVLLVSELYYPEETSTGYFVTRIAEGLADQFLVTALCSQPTYSSRGRRALTDEFRNKVTIHRCGSSTFNKDVIPLRLVNFATITLSIFFNCLRRLHSGDCVIVVTNPPFIPFAVLIASKLCGSRCCLLIHDVYPDVLVTTGIVKQNSFAMRGIGWITQILYKRMAHIIVLGRDMDTLIRKKIETAYQRIQIIPNWADVDLIKPCDRQNHPLLAQLGLSDKFIIQYSGNIGRTHGIEQLAECAEQIQNNRAVHFLFIGFGGKKLWLIQRKQKRCLSNMTIIDYRPREELSVSLTACDISVISFMGGMTGISVPSRMYNVMAAGKPIIAVADPDSELSLVVREEDIGWVVAPGDVDRLKMIILEAKDNPGKLAQMGQRARQVAETKYSFGRVKKAYTEMVASIFEKAM